VGNENWINLVDDFCVSSSTQKFTSLSLMFSRLSWELKGHTDIWDVLPVSKERYSRPMSVFLPFLKTAREPRHDPVFSKRDGKDAWPSAD